MNDGNIGYYVLQVATIFITLGLGVLNLVRTLDFKNPKILFLLLQIIV